MQLQRRLAEISSSDARVAIEIALRVFSIAFDDIQLAEGIEVALRIGRLQDAESGAKIADSLNERGRQHAAVVMRQQDCIDIRQLSAYEIYDRRFRFLINWLARQRVNPRHLLREAQSHLRQDASLDGSRPIGAADDAAYVDALVDEDLPKLVPGRILADDPDLNRAPPKRDDVCGGIGRAAGDVPL